MRLRPQVSFLQDHILNLIMIQTMHFFFSKEHIYLDYAIFLNSERNRVMFKKLLPENLK